MGSSPIFGIIGVSSGAWHHAWHLIVCGMMSSMKIAVIIPAAGKSTRYGKKDKLAEDLGGRPLLMRTVEFFTKREEITQIIVVGPPHDFGAFKERFGAALSFHGVIIVEGGKERWESVRNALEVVQDDIDRVAVHDAARPALSNDLFDQLMLATQTRDAVAAALPITGTVKRATTVKQTIGQEMISPTQSLVMQVDQKSISTR